MLAFSGRELPEGPFRAYTTRTITDPQALATRSSPCASAATRRRSESASPA